MKRFFLTIFWCCFLLLMVGCKKDLTDKLQGKWQLKSVEQMGVTVDVDTVWYNFQSESLFMYQIYWAEKDTFMYRYGFRVQQDDGHMMLELAYNPSVSVAEFLPYTDWDTGTRIFTVEKVDRKHLILSENDQVYSFTKFE